jgi:hypothetical protein
MSLVEDAAEIQRAYAEMLRDAVSRLGLSIELPPVLRVESRAGLHARAGVRDAPEGLCGLYVRDGAGAPTIHVLAPLPRARLCAVLAHEIAHAWQAEHCPDAQSTRLREGFAEWVSWTLLRGRDGGRAERDVIEARTDIYGEGFRVFAELDARGGAARAIRYAQCAVSFAEATPR